MSDGITESYKNEDAVHAAEKHEGALVAWLEGQNAEALQLLDEASKDRARKVRRLYNLSENEEKEYYEAYFGIKDKLIAKNIEAWKSFQEGVGRYRSDLNSKVLELAERYGVGKRKTESQWVLE